MNKNPMRGKEMKRRTIRIIAFLLIMVFMMNHASMNALAAPNKNEQAVRAQVVKLMKNVKAYNSPGIVKCFQPRKYRSGFYTFNQKSKYAATIRQVHNKHLKYKIEKVSIKGNKAKAKVNVTYYDLYYVYRDAFWSMVAYNLKHPNAINSKNMEAKTYEFMNKAIKKNKTYPLTQITCYIPLVKRNGKWQIEKMTKNMDYCIGCRYRQSITNMAKEFD